MEKKLELMVTKMKEACGDNLVSVLLYGSKAVTEGAGKNSDYNILVILNEASYESQNKLVPALSGWLSAGNTPPLVFSAEIFRGSADVFPIEFLDMKANRKILFGADPLDGLEISKANLRHQCEFELKGKLLKLAQGCLSARGNAGELRRVMAGSISSILVILRHIVRLTGQEPPADKIEAAGLLGKAAGFSPDVFNSVLKLKNGEQSFDAHETEKLMAGYQEAIDKAAKYIDGLN